MSANDNDGTGVQLTALEAQPNTHKNEKIPSSSTPTPSSLGNSGITLPEEEEIDAAFFAEDQYEEDEFGNRIEKEGDTEREKERARLEAQKKKEEEAALPRATVRELFQFCDSTDSIILILSILGAIAQGASMPIMSLYMGNLINDLNEDSFTDKIEQVCIYFAILACAAGLGGFLCVGGFMYTAERQAKRLRNRYLRAMLRQDISWYDQASLGDVSSRLTAYSRKYQDGVGDKMGIAIANVTCFFVGLVVAFYRGWELTLVILAPAPVMLIVSAIFASMIATSSSGELGSYATANAVALQTFDSIRTVVSYQMEKFLLGKYTKYSLLAYRDGKRKGFQIGAGIGSFFLIIFLMYALGLWYGASLMKRGRLTWPGGDEYTGGAVLSVFYALLMGCMMLGQSATNFSTIAAAQSALGSIMEILNRPSEINPYLNSADNLDKLQVTRPAFTGGISFQSVSFRYPTRPEALVLDKFTYTFEPYSSCALVGASGCGKTSLMQLIERFYDPTSGNIYIEIDLDQFDRTLEDNRSFDPVSYAKNYPDIPTQCSYKLHQTFRGGQVTHRNPRANTHPLPPNTCWVNLKDISVSLWRRECIGLVNQQPVLFNGTIGENLRYGRPDATQEEIEAVAKKCNAHDFIIAKSRGYDTNVGENGSLLSGGQKQRLSLARTLMIKKCLVLFDEITAQVDSISERQIQNTIDELLASKSFSSISIAHRLSTIRGCDQILCMKDGQIMETGTHKELVAIGEGGLYFAMTTVNADNQKSIAISDDELRRANEREADPDEQVDEADDGMDDGDLNTADQNQTEQQLIETNHDDHHDPISSKRFSTTIRSSKRDFDSTGNKIDEAKKKNQYKMELPSGYLRRFTWQYLSTHWRFIIPAVLWGGGEGAAFPVYSILMARILTYYYLDDKSEMYTKVSQFCGWFVLLAFAAGICAFFKMVFLSIPAERVVLWFRTKVFENLLAQEIGFHDEEKNTSSVLTTKLAADTGHASELTVGIFGQIISVTINIVVAFSISFTHSWQMTLIMMIVFPILTACGVVQFKVISGFGSKSKSYIEKAGLIAVEGIRNIRVVASFNAEEVLYRKFASKQSRIVRIGARSAIYSGLGFGATQLFMFGSYAFAFWFLSWLVQRGHATFEQGIAVFFLGEGASMMAGNFLAQLSNIDKGRAALIDLYQLLDRKSLYDCRSDVGEEHPVPNGKVEFKNVKFHYPTAPLLPVINDVNFTLDPTTLPIRSEAEGRECYLVGLIGTSGGGKSTLVSQLLPHFYRTIQPGGDENLVIPNEGMSQEELDQRNKHYQEHKKNLERKLKKKLDLQPRDPAEAGQILIDGKNVDSFKLSHLRKHIALVQQEPIIFHGTIRENIMAGDESITEEEMVNAAKIAYIHHVIEKLPKKYDTLLTSNNSLSGGQKARLCCARALARKNLKILIFDESTSALDVNSAKVITTNLKVALKDKMIIFIAHRLETIVNAQKILVLDNGMIAENGTHEELYKKNGIYANLVRLQQ